MVKNTHLLEEIFFLNCVPAATKQKLCLLCSEPAQINRPTVPLPIAHFLELWNETKGALVVREFTIPMGLLKIKDRKEMKGVPW